MGRAGIRTMPAGVTGRFAQVMGGAKPYVANVRAEREAENRAARALGPLWMRLDDDRSEVFEDAAVLYARALAAKISGGEITTDERHLLGSLPRYAVREAVTAGQPTFRRAAATLDAAYKPPAPAACDELAGHLSAHLQELVADGMRPDLMATSVRECARRVIFDHAALTLYDSAVKPNPHRAAQLLGVRDKRLRAASTVTPEQWQRALDSWLSAGAQTANAYRYVTLYIKDS